MKRRHFIESTLASGIGATFALFPADAQSHQTVPKTNFHPTSFQSLPDSIAGMSLKELRDDYHDRIFNQYLPFWDKGGYDKDLGGFMCELNDDGSVQNDEKYIWYQGRGIWAYAFLYNKFGKDKRFLDIAVKSRDFMLKHMYIGDGLWHESVDRSGKAVKSTVSQGTSKDIYGAMFAASGLIELYKVAGNEKDLDIAKTSIWNAMKAYNDPCYEGVTVENVDIKGLRAQGHSFMVVWPLTQLLSFHHDQALEELQQEHVNHIMNHFWNPDYGIMNENLLHDYSRISGREAIMFTGHSLETLWMIMYEALRIKDKNLFDTAKTRLRRLIEMDWDYVFEGLGTDEYHVFGTDTHCQGPLYDLKTMWAHNEVLIGTMTILEYTGEVWAKEWYERTREYAMRTMANTGNGVWRQAVDRFGNDKKRPNVSIYRKDNFHQIRYQMNNLLSLDRILRNNGELTPFPS